MIGTPQSHDVLFIPGSLRSFIPDDHILVQVEAILDLSWLRDEVRDLYDTRGGRPSIPPESAVRLMLAGFFLGLVQDRALLREAQVNLAIRWFARYPLDQTLPDHSTLSKLRTRWGADRFKRIFQRTVQQCLAAGLVSGETVHVDATLIRADVSWASVVEHHAAQVLQANAPAGASPPRKKRSTTDPDASLTTAHKHRPMEPCYKQHTAVDDQAGIIIDVAVETGEASEGTQLPAQLGRVAEATGELPRVVTADSGYAHATNYAVLEGLAIDAVIPPPRQGRPAVERMPARRFRYDAVHQRVRCPAGQALRFLGVRHGQYLFRATAATCQACPRRARCFAASATARTLHLPIGYEALLRARRRKARGWDAATRRHYRRHRWLVEGVHGEGKTCHGLRRAVRRGLAQVAIQVYLTAAVINLKRLAKHARRRSGAAVYAGVGAVHGWWWAVTSHLVACATVARREPVAVRQAA
jgi:transposase